MAARAAAYIRRSSADEDSPGDVSKEAQLVAVRGLAMAAGIDPDSLAVYEDWGKSADERKKSKRTAYLRLLSDIKARKFTHVFAYHTDRLIRSVADFTELTEVADGHTTIQVPGMTLTGSDPMAKAFAQLAAVFAELELGRIKERVNKGFAVRRSRGDVFGSSRYGYRLAKDPATKVISWERDPSVPLDQVLEVVRANGGNVLKSCLDLKAMKVPAPKGGDDWATSALTRIIEREAPDLRPRKARDGKRQPTTSVLTGLVRCPTCDATMTPVGTRNGLYCRNGQRTPHPKYFTKDAAVLAMLHEATDGRTFTRFSFAVDDAAKADIVKAEERWRRANRRYQMGGIGDAEYEAEAKRWKAAQDKAEGDDTGLRLDVHEGMPYVRWDADTATVNGDLRRIISEVRLDPTTLAPVELVWRNPRMAPRQAA